MSLLLAVWPYKNKIYRISVKRGYPNGPNTEAVETIYITEKVIYTPNPPEGGRETGTSFPPQV